MGSDMRVLFDTEEYVTTLTDGGVPEKQAHAMSRGLSRAFNQGIATSEDIVRLEGKTDGAEKGLSAKLDGVEKRLEAKLDGMEGRLSAKLDGVEKSLNTKIDAHKDRMEMLMYLTIALVALTNPVSMHIFKLIGPFH